VDRLSIVEGAAICCSTAAAGIGRNDAELFSDEGPLYVSRQLDFPGLEASLFATRVSKTQTDEAVSKNSRGLGEFLLVDREKADCVGFQDGFRHAWLLLVLAGGVARWAVL